MQEGHCVRDAVEGQSSSISLHTSATSCPTNLSKRGEKNTYVSCLSKKPG
uniref:Uncharacterized protein n=1 Tax=Anguilla anguilla TaxID=7936 RepID=A0A0E9XZE9_ANGAN